MRRDYLGEIKMENEYLLINKKILPDFFTDVLKAKNMVDNENKSVSDACKEVNISRSTYYKYKDFIRYPDEKPSKKAVLSFKVDDIPGILSFILSKIYECKANVLTISQTAPIQGIAYITITLTIDNMLTTVEKLTSTISAMDHVLSATTLK